MMAIDYSLCETLKDCKLYSLIVIQKYLPQFSMLNWTKPDNTFTFLIHNTFFFQSIIETIENRKKNPKPFLAGFLIHFIRWNSLLYWFLQINTASIIDLTFDSQNMPTSGRWFFFSFFLKSIFGLIIFYWLVKSIAIFRLIVDCVPIVIRETRHSHVYQSIVNSMIDYQLG